MLLLAKNLFFNQKYLIPKMCVKFGAEIRGYLNAIFFPWPKAMVFVLWIFWGGGAGGV